MSERSLKKAKLGMRSFKHVAFEVAIFKANAFYKHSFKHSMFTFALPQMHLHSAIFLNSFKYMHTRRYFEIYQNMSFKCTKMSIKCM